MKKQIGVAFCVFTLCMTMAAQSEPALAALKMPRYPWLAVQGRAEGIVRVTFTLSPHAEEPTNVELITMPPTSRGAINQLLQNAALENVKNGDLQTPTPSNIDMKSHSIFSLAVEPMLCHFNRFTT